jgi:hypothetical protein
MCLLSNNVADVDAAVDDIAPDVGVINVGVEVAAHDGGSAVLVEEVGLLDVCEMVSCVPSEVGRRYLLPSLTSPHSLSLLQQTSFW